MLITSILAISILVGCDERENAESTTNMKGAKGAAEKKHIDDFVTIKDAVNKEGVSPNGEKVKYIYEVPTINIDKPGAQKINDMFLNLVKGMEDRIGDGQNMTLLIKSKVFLNAGIISVVMEMDKPGPSGIYVVNYNIEDDKEISTKELIEKYEFDPQKLIIEINRQVKINENKPMEEKNSISIDYFVNTIIANIYKSPSNDDLKNMEEIQNKTKEEKEKYVIKNIDKIKAYINNDGKFVFIHISELNDEEFAVDLK